MVKKKNLYFTLPLAGQYKIFEDLRISLSFHLLPHLEAVVVVV